MCSLESLLLIMHATILILCCVGTTHRIEETVKLGTCDTQLNTDLHFLLACSLRS